MSTKAPFTRPERRFTRLVSSPSLQNHDILEQVQDPGIHRYS